MCCEVSDAPSTPPIIPPVSSLKCSVNQMLYSSILVSYSGRQSLHIPGLFAELRQGPPQLRLPGQKLLRIGHNINPLLKGTTSHTHRNLKLKG